MHRFNTPSTIAPAEKVEDEWTDTLELRRKMAWAGFCDEDGVHFIEGQKAIEYENLIDELERDAFPGCRPGDHCSFREGARTAFYGQQPPVSGEGLRGYRAALVRKEAA